MAITIKSVFPEFDGAQWVINKFVPECPIRQIDKFKADPEHYYEAFKCGTKYNAGDRVVSLIQLSNKNEYIISGYFLVDEFEYVDSADGNKFKVTPLRVENADEIGSRILRSNLTPSEIGQQKKRKTKEAVDKFVNSLTFEGRIDVNRIEWTGAKNFTLNWNELNSVLKNPINEDFKTALSRIKGVYLQVDTKTGKMYVGSAYGKEGIAQRWRDYADTCHGGNDGLIKLVNEKGLDYIKENFEYSIIEVFPMGTDDQTILDEETKQKKRLHTREFGYNKN